MSLSAFKDKSLVLVLAYSPFGLGHLRVTDALAHGLPTEITPILLGAQDTSLTTLYRIASIHPLTRLLMLGFEYGLGEELFTYFYRRYMNNHAELLYRQLVTILDQRIDTPKTMLIVATHFGLAHQLAKIKNRIMKEKNIKIILAVQITDDSPQYIWYVPGANVIFAPSMRTAENLLSYARKFHLPLVKMVVNSYPVSPMLSKELSEEKYKKRIGQLDPKAKAKIHVAIPLSGAAVGMRYYQSLMQHLHAYTDRFSFHIIGKNAPYTKKFLETASKEHLADLHISNTDREVVSAYEKTYQEENISLEVTKPSEQAFKALLCPNYIGGSILLFTEPVGRQERDNLYFLKRHHLIPTEKEQTYLEHASLHNIPLIPKDTIVPAASHWRGICLPKDSQNAAKFIVWLLKQGILFQMDINCPKGHRSDETDIHGTHRFWEYLDQLVIKEQLQD